jgi:ATP-binding cassette, subfamily B, multidrug efflux pump
LQSRIIILKYFKKHWPRYISGLMIVFIATYLNTMIPRRLGLAVDALNSPDINIEEVRRIAAVLAIISIAAFLSRFIWRYLIIGFCRYIEFYLRENLFAHLQNLTADFYVKNNTGDIITRSIVDVQAVRMMLGFGMISIIDVIVTTTMSIINMSVSINIYFTLLAFAPIPPLILIIMKVRKLIKKRYLRVQESISDISSKVQENITGIRVIKSFSQEDKEVAVFNILSTKKVKAETKLARAFAVMNPSVTLAFGVVFSIFLVAGGSMVANQKVSLGDFVSFNTYLLLIMAPIGSIGKIVDRWQRGITSMKRLDKILLTKPSIDDSGADISILNIDSGAITANDLSFSFDNGETILKNISFSVPPGRTLAIMGPTGCGKSKILELIMRLWKCEDEMLFIDGKDINLIPVKLLRTKCAYVPQDTFLFSDTIMENIRFYDSKITDDQVFEAAKAAFVHDSIIDFPLGYNTVVGERGMTLSGGQKQRIALARALVTQPKILLLDDCMSAVDAETEKEIIKNLRNMLTACTAVIVTHRLSAAGLADAILLLNSDGEVEESGNHNQLMSIHGAYSKLVETMLAGEALNLEDGDNNA